MSFDRARKHAEIGDLGAHIPGETQAPNTFQTMTRILRAMPDSCARAAERRRDAAGSDES
jgi:hypothetical protein